MTQHRFSSFWLPRAAAVLAALTAIAIVLLGTILQVQGAQALAGESAFRTITDRSGRRVRIPETPRRIACLFGPSYEKLLAFGATDRVSMVANVTLPWNLVLNPGLGAIPVLTTYGSPDVETLLRLKTDLVIYHPFTKQINQMTAAGLPVVVPYDGSRRQHTLEGFFKDWYGQIRFYGKILGGDAVARAEVYCDYADRRIRDVLSVTAEIPKDRCPKVFWYCGQVNGPAGTQTRHATADWLVTAAGGTMLTHEEAAYFVSVSTEELILWNPDIILVSTLPSVEPVLSDPRLKNIAAVQNQRVFMTPQGQFYWSHFSTESFLCILYLAKLFHPEKFPDLDMVEELTGYYAQFYHYDLTGDQARRILSHLPPGSKDQHP
ncbi:ABC transporter substrate-binding protein [Desulfospira joergensenii]|uniref:ABC transporter substrate-binding protein n=1 Tax=Desulfospira joergensenii TaxID=53329 RepID=UPI0003B4BF66|nr:ABC transporter substrate-binding protein [Desulfospira joergensenii]